MGQEIQWADRLRRRADLARRELGPHRGEARRRHGPRDHAGLLDAQVRRHRGAFGGGPLTATDTQGFIAKLTPDAELLWSRLLGSQVSLDAVATSPDGETLIAGWTKAVDADFGTGPLPWTGDGSLQHLVIAKLGR
ncbi:hypothetical protein [Sorangium sp. So ce1182]|uniref:hypothetical protein n=1 Tax=Sorangium sp. So ce1182 TaxID=3133334 RepID=UPI003F636A3F